MRNWNVILTVLPGPGHENRLLQGLRPLGEFHRSGFKDVCLGRVEDAERFLEGLQGHRNGRAQVRNGQAWRNGAPLRVLARDFANHGGARPDWHAAAVSLWVPLVLRNFGKPRNQELVHPAFVHIYDLEAQARELEVVGLGGNAA